MRRFRSKAPVLVAGPVFALVLALLLVLGLTACGETVGGGTIPSTSTIDTSNSTTPETSASTSSTSSTTPSSGTTTTEALSSAETRLPNGNIRAMGFIDQIRIDGSRNHLRIDYAELLTGDAAVAAAIAAGVIDPGEELDSDYFISNVNPQFREFQVSDAVVITTSTYGGVMNRPTTWDEFESFWRASPPAGATHLRDVPWWIERDGDAVVKIDEQYLP